MPTAVNIVYKSSRWVGYGDWLDTDSVSNSSKLYLTFDKAREYM